MCFGYLANELVVLFHSADEMLVMVHGVIKAMALCEKPIWLHTSPPSTTHVRAYVVVREGEPSGALSLTPDREEVPQPSHSNPMWMGGPPSVSDGSWRPWGCPANAAHGGPLPEGSS